MSRVEWTRLVGEDVEAVVSMLLCLEFPDAVRVRPAQGDGGIDVLVPLPDDGVAVYQVKRHAENLSTSQRAKLAASHERMRTSEFAQRYDIRRWHPTMPIDPTPTDLMWMSGVAEGQPWEAHWKGLSFIEALVAKYPMVVDYYLHDGKQRADNATARVTELLKTQLGVSAGSSLTPRDAITALHSLFGALDDADPFYLYGLSVDPTQPRLDAGALPKRTVMAAQYELPGESWATIKVIARANESLIERPVSLNVIFDPGDDEELHEKFRDFMKYGTPFEAPSGTVSGNMDAPGGLGGPFTDGAFSFTSMEDLGENPDLRMQVLDPADTVLAECQIHRVERSVGPSRQGLRVVFESDHGVFLWEMKFDLEANTTTGAARGQFVAGKAPSDALAALQVLSQLRHPNHIRTSLRHGPASAGASLTPFPPGVGVDLGDLVSLVEALAEIQKHTTTRLTIPDPATVTDRQRHDLERIAELLRSETVQRPWLTPATLHGVGSPPVLDEELFNARAHAPLVARVGQEQVELGWVRNFYMHCHPAPGGPRVDGDSWELVLMPTESSFLVMQRVSDPESP